MRIIALFIIVLPGIIATFGIKLMRDAFFGIYSTLLINEIIQFILGFILFVAGLAFIGGYILHRDRKRYLTKGRFKQQEK